MNKVILTFIALLVTGPAWSSLIEVDIFSDGTNAGFKNATSNLTWLDMGQTQNKSFNQVIEMTREGRIWDGWRLPTQSEVAQLWNEAIGSNYSWKMNGISRYYLYEPIDSAVVDHWYQLAEVMGTTEQGTYFDTGVSWFSSIGIYQADDGLLVSSHFATYQMMDGYLEGHIESAGLFERICDPSDTACTPTDYRNEGLMFRSTMLVKSDDVAVSEPTSLALLSIAFAVFMRNNKRARRLVTSR